MVMRATISAAGLVQIANKRNLKTFEHQKKVVNDQKQKIVRNAQAVGDQLSAVSLVIPMKVGEEGKTLRFRDHHAN